MSEPNGQGKSRLDRIEEIIERQERANEAAHLRFEAEDQRLLTAQVLMNGALQKMLLAVEKMSEGTERMRESIAASESKQSRFDENMVILEMKMQETTEKLNALIETVDGMIRKKPPQQSDLN
ncbi:MAG: hypothetical protein ABSB15_14505 [Bryobacteraceae bacterium]|jgi:hypothetical protein